MEIINKDNVDDLIRKAESSTALILRVNHIHKLKTLLLCMITEASFKEIVVQVRKFPELKEFSMQVGHGFLHPECAQL